MRKAVAIVLAAMILLVGRSSLVQAQATPPKAKPPVVPGVGVGNPGAGVSRRIPADDYFIALSPYYSGDFITAKRAFQDSARGGMRTIEGKWIDSICYHSMIGECYFQMGDLAQALDQHTSAIKIFLAYPGWMLRVDFPPALEPAAGGARIAIPWGNSNRVTQLGRFPDTYQTFQGKSDAENAQAAQQGGVVATAQLVPLHVVEIQRCLATSIRRRLEILGPNCPHDPLTTALVDALSRRPAPPNHWSQSWIDVHLGLAYASAGKREQAASEFQKGLLAGGQYEHPLSCVALLMLGRLAYSQEQYDPALSFFMEATYSAATYRQYDVMQEAFYGALQAHVVSGKKEVFAPLLPAAQWARRISVPLEATLLTLAAQSFGAAGDPARGIALVGEARRAIGRHELAIGSISAMNQFELARLQFQSGNTAAGDAALATALAYQVKSSPRLFQTSIADGLFTSGVLGERAADQLFTELLREPRPEDWVRDPLETLAVSMTPRPGPIEHWMDLAHARKDAVRALEIADQARRQQFHGSLPLGGRLMALRWVLGAPPEALSDRANLQRRDLLARFPAFAELERQAAELRAALEKGPLNAEDDAMQQERAAQYQQLAKLSLAQETILHDMAVERVAADSSFPPTIGIKELQAKLPQGTLVLSYVASSRGLTGFVMNHEKFAAFPIATPTKLRGDVAELLKKLGNRDGNQPLDAKDLEDDSWRTIARRLLPVLTNNTPAEAWDNYDELVIVPDGFLWYLPFELLPVGAPGDERPLLTKVRIRYAPTLGLVAPDARPLRPLTRTAVVAGRLYPRDDVELTVDAAARLQASLPEASKLSNRLPGPSSMVAKFCDRLLVLHDLDDEERVPYEWSPVQIDRAKPGSSLSAFFPLPWGGPSQYVYPGFHTAAESGLKKGAAGDEVFLTLCGLMSTGARTVMLSRWRVGGNSTFGLMHEFVQELPHSAASEAWQRSVQLQMMQRLDPTGEPRLRWPADSEPPLSEHPFFWAGYLLADTGVVPPKPAAP